MAVSSVIRIGDKIDIKVEQRVEKDGKLEYVPSVYNSQVLDIKGDGKFEASMPIEKGKVIVLPLNMRFEIVFNTQSGNVYKSVAVVTERYRAEGRYMMELQLKKGLEKIQRREFFRYPCLIEFDFFILQEYQKEKSAEELYMEFMEGRLAEVCHGMTTDLSGGGMRFSSSYELDKNSKIFIVLYLQNEVINRDFYMIADVVTCKSANIIGKVAYESRVKFVIEDDEMREDIIRFIFEEERRRRKR